MSDNFNLALLYTLAGAKWLEWAAATNVSTFFGVICFFLNVVGGGCFICMALWKWWLSVRAIWPE